MLRLVGLASDSTNKLTTSAWCAEVSGPVTIYAVMTLAPSSVVTPQFIMMLNLPAGEFSWSANPGVHRAMWAEPLVTSAVTVMRFFPEGLVCNKGAVFIRSKNPDYPVYVDTSDANLAYPLLVVCDGSSISFRSAS